MAITTDQVGVEGGPVICPNCDVQQRYEFCARCGHEFSEPWLMSRAEYQRRLHVGYGHTTIDPPRFLGQIQ